MCTDLQASLAETSRLAEVSRMMADAPRDADFIDLGTKYVAALEARDKAQRAHERACEAVLRCEAEMRAAYERLTGEGKSDGK